MKTLVLAHYYTSPEVQKMADFVGDSLELAKKAIEEKPDRIVFAGVRFMAETVKMMLPETEVILPHTDSTCSLVEQTDVRKLYQWVQLWKSLGEKPTVHVMYINSSVEMKSLADVIVTSRNVEEIVGYYAENGHRVLFSPDYNMGQYLKYIHPDWDIHVWSAVCEVHDRFKAEELEAMVEEYDKKFKNVFVVAHPESPLPVLELADYVGSTSRMLEYVATRPGPRAAVLVATEEGILYNMRELRPDLEIVQAPVYSGCQCNLCPYMKFNTPELVQGCIEGLAGVNIDYLSEELISKAKYPVEKMLNFFK